MKLRIKYPSQRMKIHKLTDLHPNPTGSSWKAKRVGWLPGGWYDRYKAIGKLERWMDLPVSASNLYSRLHPNKELSTFNDLLKRLHKLYK